MKTIVNLLSKQFQAAITAIFTEISNEETFLALEVVQSTSPTFGHYQCNSAMKLAKVLKQKPRDIAQKLIKYLDEFETTEQLIESASIAGPGFINIKISLSFLEKKIPEILSSDKLGIDMPTTQQRIIVEFSSPNIAKELHVGHLRSTIIGECLTRLFEFFGYDVLRLNHIGDWGTPFGMLIAYMKDKAPKVLSGEQVTDLSHLAKWYQESRKLFDSDESFKKRSHEEVVKLQAKESDAYKAWEIICDISRKAYLEIYDLLDVTNNDRGESFYNDQLPQVINDFEAKDLVTISNGAKCVYLEGFTNREGDLLPIMIQKSDGGYNYASTDLAAIRHRVEVERADRVIVVTDAGQRLHFQMVFKAAELIGYLDRNKVQVDHVTFGLVLGPDGTKFKTRSGNTEKLIDLLNEGISKALEIIQERTPEMDKEEQKKLAKALGIGSIKYADLSSLRTKDYIFSYDKMLRFEGNTATFLLYAYVRTQGIKRKVHFDINKIEEISVTLEHPTEQALALYILQFGETLDDIIRDLLPNRLTDYLYNLAEKFHAFFRDCRVIGSDLEKSRLILIEACGQTLSQGLTILGLETVERM